LGIGPEGQEVVGGLGGGAGGADDGTVVLADDVQPEAEIVGMADGRNDAKGGADESPGHLGDQLLLAVIGCPERLGIAIELAV
jgi:hypothetical protein